METIGQRIEKARKKAKMNQKELASKANITETSLSRYENDIREPKSAVLGQLADVLGVSCDYLIGLTDDIDFKRGKLNDLEPQDIEDIIDDTSKKITNGALFYGKPASKEAVDSLLKGLRMGLLLALEEQNKSENN